MPTKRFIVIQGPNLNLLGRRDPEHYGSASLEELEGNLRRWALERGFEWEFFQSNREGELVEALQGAAGRMDGAVLNPGGFAHGSVVLRDAILALDLPVVEVHLSHLHRRESWRQRSLSAGACLGVISGLGEAGYRLALIHLSEL